MAKAGCGVIIVLFSAAFCLVGYLIFAAGVRPAWQTLAAARWSEVPCVVSRAELQEHDGGADPTTYSIEVAYTYRVEGVEHHGARYSFDSGSSNFDEEGMRATVGRLTREPRQRCWVDPADASSAVLVRALPSSTAMLLLVFGQIASLLLFVLVRASGSPDRSPHVAPTSGPLRLSSRHRSGVGLIVLAAIPTIWAVGFVLYLFAHTSGFERIPVLFAAFVAWSAVRGLLSMFNPVPELELDRGGLRVGDKVEVRCIWRGNHRRIIGLELALVSREEVVTGSGTDTRELSRVVFHESSAGGAGPIMLHIPADAVPSLDLPNNRVKWLIVVKGRSRFFPVGETEFPLVLLPPENDPASVDGQASAGGPITLSGGRTAFRRGDTVDGKIDWSLIPERARPAVRLVWRTSGTGTVDTDVVDSLVLTKAAATGEHEFSLLIPADAPVSCSGKLVSVQWAVELWVDAVERLGHVDLVVGPTGTEQRSSWLPLGGLS